jgi:hypothetical protein
MSVEYIFFDTEPRDRFVQFLSSQGLSCQSRDDVMEGFVVELPVDPDDELLDTIEDRYQALMDEQMVQAESDPDWVKQRVASVNITRLDGSACSVRLPPSVARSLLEHFSSDEVHAIVTAIAHSLDNPIDAPLCCKDEAALARRKG